MTAILKDEKERSDFLLVKKSYLIGFLYSVLVVILGLIVSFFINYFYPLSETAIILFQAFSIVPGSTSLFAVQGWDIQSWSGHSPAEHLNQKIFKRLAFIGLFTPVVAFSLNSPAELPGEVDHQLMQKLKTEILQDLYQKKIQFSAHPQ